MSNPWFHAKITLFIVIGLCPPPTLSFLRWRSRRASSRASCPPSPRSAAPGWVMIESHLFILLPLLCVLMARGIGM